LSSEYKSSEKDKGEAVIEQIIEMLTENIYDVIPGYAEIERNIKAL